MAQPALMGDHKIVEVIAKVAGYLDNTNLVNYGDKQLQRNRALPALDPPLSTCTRLDPYSHKRSHADSPTIGKNEKHREVRPKMHVAISKLPRSCSIERVSLEPTIQTLRSGNGR